MKQRIFTLIMLLALVFVAGSAMAQDGSKWKPYPGSAHSYVVPVVVQNNSTATITVSAGITKGTIVPGEGANAVTTLITQITIPVTFDIGATGTQKISLQLKDETSGCSNYINLDIPMMPIPTIDLAIVTTDDETWCQTVNATPASQVAGSDGQSNKLTFTVTPEITDAPTTTYTWNYVINFTGTSLTGYALTKNGTPVTLASLPLTVSNASIVTSDVYEITFTTTTGQPTIPVTGTLASVNLKETASNVTYNETDSDPNTDNIDVLSTPTLGDFQ